MDNATWVEDVTAALAAVKAELEHLGHSLEVINFSNITHETGISEVTLRKLFAGEDVASEAVNLPFKDRLTFLVATRPGDDGKERRPSEIAAAVGVSKATINALLSGARNPGFEVSRDLAEYFRVDPGFFSVRGDKALLKALEPAMRQARLLASLKGEKVELLALRGSLAGGSPQLAQELQEVLEAVVATARGSRTPQPVDTADDDPDLREFADTMRSLPLKKRRGVLKVLRTVVGMDKDT
ncbi:helix-turn-helix domain-containing protein [Streptomyces prunicolor]|uniref:helix-turn-helix domain-containing protein n=1 Tax=Streptomyces prunicolor TaxID=67348 RepID=UPI0003643A2A|nr:helix-turn-helix domain-containing protein [Streptomyces prunicolor]